MFIEWMNVMRFVVLCRVLRHSVRAMHNHSFPTVIQFYLHCMEHLVVIMMMNRQCWHSAIRLLNEHFP